MSVELQFGGIDRLYGKGSIERLQRSRVLIVGLGGVGSWTAEALGRSGIGTLGLMDLDDICITNTNRQIHTTSDTIGMSKAEALAQRIQEITPHCHVEPWLAYYREDKNGLLRDWKPDLVIDAIDSVSAKAQLIAAMHPKIPLVISGGAGGKQDGTRFQVGDLAHAQGDSLLRQVRKVLRQEHGFPKGDGKRPPPLGIASVFSDETPRFPWANGTTCETPEPGSSLKLDCASGFGTASHVTGALGLALAGEAIKILLSRPHASSQ